jgi:hypothetical protein
MPVKPIGPATGVGRATQKQALEPIAGAGTNMLVFGRFENAARFAAAKA